MKDIRITRPSQIDVDANFPVSGKARNIVTTGDNTGTPWAKDIINDRTFGWQERILTIAGIVANDTEESAAQSQIADAIEILIKIVSSGYDAVGSFHYGFTYTSDNDVGVYQGQAYKYVGASNYPVVVNALTNPVGNSDYELVVLASHNSFSDRNAVGAHDDIYVRTVTSAEAIAEDAPLGTRYTLSDRFNWSASVESTGTGNGYDSILMNNGFYLNLDTNRIVDVLALGATPNQDNTDLLKYAFQTSYDIAISKPYLIDAVDENYPTSSYGGGLKPADGTKVYGFLDGSITVAANDKPAYVCINLAGSSDVTIYDLEVIGDVETHTDTGGEFGFGFYQNSSTNINLVRCKANKFWGDGFYIGDSSGGNPTKRGGLQHCVADANRRQGLSIVSWVEGLVSFGEYKNTGSILETAPAFGIDIEPNPADNEIDVQLIGVRTSGNARGGIQCVPGFMSNAAATGKSFIVNISGHYSHMDGINGGFRCAWPDLSNSEINISTKVNGLIEYNGTIVKAARRGVDFARWIPSSPDVKLNDVSVIDCNEDNDTSTIANQCAYVIAVLSSDSSNQTRTGKVDMINCVAKDTRSTPRMLIPAYLNVGGATQAISNVNISNFSAENWLSASNSAVNANIVDDCSISYNKDVLIELSGSTALSSARFAGETVTLSSSGVITLPKADSSIGLKYILDNRNAVTYQVRPFSGDEILTYGNGIDNDAVMRKSGTRLELLSIGAGKWLPVYATGEIAPLGTLPTLTQNGIRQVTASPVGNLTPRYIGEEVLDTVAEVYYKSYGILNSDWKLIN